VPATQLLAAGGSGGCDACARGGVPIGVVLIAASGLLLFLGPRLSTLLSPASLALLHAALLHAQCAALTLSLRLPWPPRLAAVLAWTHARPGCDAAAAAACAASDATMSSYDAHLWMLLAALLAVLATAAALHASTRIRARTIALHARHAVATSAEAAAAAAAADAAALTQLHALRAWRAGMGSCVLAVLSCSYLYVLYVLAQAWECTADDAVAGGRLRAYPDALCAGATRAVAGGVLISLIAGAPLIHALWLRRLQRRGGSRAAAAAVRDLAHAPLLLRPAWRGLADPATHTAWAAMYGMVRHTRLCAHMHASGSVSIITMH
jgi:hypothetical protein